ncbi:MAG: universal stress protein [Dehalococcoidales bacterium]|nr:universal stress protein [Dehalococcoidales bacterium]
MYTKILVLLDGSEISECVLPYVEWFMKVSRLDEVVFLRVEEPFKMLRGMETAVIPEDRERIEKDADRLAMEYLDGIVGRFKKRKTKVRPMVLRGKPVQVIADYVTRGHIDLLIMATHAYSGVHRLFGASTADGIIHTVTAPIFLVTPKDRPPDK